jgi:lipopolysaccharide export system permease protein
VKRLDRYIIRKFLGTFFLSISLLIIIVIIFDVSEHIDDFLDKKAPLKEIVLVYYLNFIPYFVNLFSYLFTFIAVIYFTSKMASQSEIIAILSSGVSYRRLLVPYLVAATFLGLLSYLLMNFIIPVTNARMMNFEKTYLKNRSRLKDINIHMQTSPGTYLYLEGFNNFTNVGHKFSLERFDDKVLTYKLRADVITWDSLKNTWRLQNCQIRTRNNGNERISFRNRIDTTLNLKPADFMVNVDDVKTMNYFKLRDFISEQHMKGSERIKDFEVEMNRRTAFPFATIILTVIGMSLSARKVRGGIGVHLGFGIMLTFAFILFMQVSTVFATKGDLSPLAAVWIPNLLFAVLGLYLLRSAPK